MTTPSSVPAQGEAMEQIISALQKALDALDRDVSTAPINESYARAAQGWMRGLFGDDVRAAIDRARALVAASPCAAQPASDALLERVERALEFYANPAVYEADSIGRRQRITFVADAALTDLRALRQQAAAAQGGQQPAGWAHSEDPDRVISAAQKRQAEKDGGASASSVRAYTIALCTAPAAPAAPLTARMLTASELDAIPQLSISTYMGAAFVRSDDVARRDADVQRKFCDLNGITLAGTAQKESEHG